MSDELMNPIDDYELIAGWQQDGETIPEADQQEALNQIEATKQNEQAELAKPRVTQVDEATGAARRAAEAQQIAAEDATK